MRGSLIFISIFLSHFASAQFAIVSDKDGFSNIRKAAGLGNKITDTLHNGHFVYGLEKKGNWISIDYKKDRQEQNGYIYHDRLKRIDDYENIPLIAGSDSVFSKDSLKVILSGQPFVGAFYRLTYHKYNPSVIQFIDGRPYYGRDGEIPRTEYKSIIITLGSKKITLPKTATHDLFEPNIAAAQVHYDRKNDILYIQSIGGDGAGYYEVIWKVEKGVYVDRYIAYGF